MTNAAHDLLLLLINLSQQTSADRIKTIFQDALQDLFHPISLKWLEDKEEGNRQQVPVATFNKKYGILEVQAPNGEGTPETLSLIKNAANMLAVILEKLENQHLVALDKERLQTLVEIRTKELQRSEDRFNLAMDASRDGIFDWNLTTNEIYFSPGWKRILGYEDDEIKNDFSVWEQLTNKEDVKRSWEILNEHLQGKRERFETEFKMLHKDGHWVDVLSRATAYRDEDGKAIRVVGTHVDISERKQAEAQIQEANQREIEAIKAANVGLWDWNLKTNKVRYSTEWKSQIGYQDSEIGDDFMEWESRVHPEDLPWVREQVNRSIKETRSDFQIEFRFKHKNGTYRWILAQASVVLDKAGNAAHMRGSHSDVTETKTTELLLRSRLELSERLADADIDTILQYCLDQAEMLTDSDIGFFHFVNEDQQSLSLQNWSTNTIENKCQAAGRGLHYSVDQAGVWVECIGTREPVIHNDYKSCLNKKGLPEGHPPVIRELTVPIIQNGKVTAIIGLGNKPTEYTELDVRKVQTLAGLAMDMIGRRRAELALNENKTLLQTQFANSPDLILVINREMKIVSVNRERIGKYTAKELLNSDCIGIMSEGAKKLNRAKVELCFATGEMQEFECQIIKGNWARIRLVKLEKKFDSDRVMLIATDITEAKKAEATIGEKDRLLADIINNVNEGIIVYDTDLNFKMWNPFMERLSGFAEKEVLNQPATELFPFLEKVGVVERLEQALRGEFPPAKEFKARSREGNIIWVSDICGPMRDEQGQVVGVFSTIRDITKRRKMEQSLIDSESRYRLLADNTLDVIWLMDLNLTFTYVNPSIVQLTGFSPEEWIGTNLSDHCDEEEFVKMAEIAGGEMMNDSENRGVVFESVFIKKSGERFPVEIVGKVILDDLGAPIALQGVTRDITERKKAETALQQANALLQAAMDCSPAGIVIADAPDAKIRYANDAALRIKGKGNGQRQDGEETETYIDSWLIHHLDGSICQRDEIPLVRAIKFGETGDRQLVIHRPDEQDRVVWMHAAPILDDTRKAIAGIAVFPDITDLKQAEDENKKLEEQFRQAQKMESIGRLAGGVAHDFNNLLTGITGNVTLALMDLSQGDPLIETLGEIKKAADSAASLTRQLLAFSRKQIIDPKVLDLNQVIKSMHNMLQRLIGEDIDLRTIPKKELGRIKVDPGQVEQVLVNLVVNARDAMPDGGKLTIETGNVVLDEDYCRANSQVEPGDYVMLAVSDNGEGMDLQTQRMVFDPFFTTKKEGKGTGLGLATTYGVIKQHSGHIKIYSELGKGTTFKVYLPRVHEKVEELTRGSVWSGLPMGTESVLVVEDESMVRNIAIKILARQGYKVHHADTGATAIAMVEKDRLNVDLLLTDIVMPTMNGRELATRLTAMNPKLKVLFTSGYTENVIAHHGVLEKGINFLGKPYGPQSLVQKVREVLDSEKSGDV